MLVTACQGTLIVRNEDLDPQRSRAEFARAMIEDLRWLGIRWSEGPDCGGPYGAYSQSERRALSGGLAAAAGWRVSVSVHLFA
jgi:glutamyl-tRNA synthetase